MATKLVKHGNYFIRHCPRTYNKKMQPVTMVKKQAKKTDLLKSDNVMYADLRNARWLYNPVVYSQVSGDFTLMQQRILIGVVEKLQQRIIDSVSEQHKSKSFPDIFDFSELSREKTIELIMSASDLGVTPDHYDQLEEAAKKFSTMSMKYPVLDQSGRVVSYKFAALFPMVEVPRVVERRTGMFRIVMLTEYLRDVFTMQYGYALHLSHTARIAQKKRTPRLYIYLSRYRDIGHKRVPYKHLIEFLGLTDEYFKESNSGENPYKSWSKVKRLVLDPVRQEMDELSERMEIDFSFDYKPIYPSGKTRGIPLEVEFILKKGQLAKMRDTTNKRVQSERQFIDKYVDWCPELSAYALRSLMADMDESQLENFLNFAYKDMRQIIERKQPDDVASYIMGTFRKWKCDYKLKQQQVQLDLFGRSEEESVQEDKPVFISGALAKEWQQVLNEYKEGAFAEALRKAKHIGSYLGNINIEFETESEKNAYLALTSDKKLASEYKRLIGIIKKAIGRKDSGVTLVCSVAKN